MVNFIDYYYCQLICYQNQSNGMSKKETKYTLSLFNFILWKRVIDVVSRANNLQKRDKEIKNLAISAYNSNILNITT